MLALVSVNSKVFGLRCCFCPFSGSSCASLVSVSSTQTWLATRNSERMVLVCCGSIVASLFGRHLPRLGWSFHNWDDLTDGIYTSTFSIIDHLHFWNSFTTFLCTCQRFDWLEWHEIRMQNLGATCQSPVVLYSHRVLWCVCKATLTSETSQDTITFCTYLILTLNPYTFVDLLVI